MFELSCTDTKLYRNDEVFNVLKIHEFENIANNVLSDFFIWIMQPIATIVSADPRKRLLEQFHNDQIDGGHCGQK